MDAKLFLCFWLTAERYPYDERARLAAIFPMLLLLLMFEWVTLVAYAFVLVIGLCMPVRPRCLILADASYRGFFRSICPKLSTHGFWLWKLAVMRFAEPII